MARENHPRERQAKKLARKLGRRAPHDRILIVCEGGKTEPLYLNEIRQYYRLPTANIKVLQSLQGTDPMHVVKSAKDLFEQGDYSSNIRARAFEKVYAVFDRDDFNNYHDALIYAKSLDKKLKNDDRKKIRFEAVASVPNFELWLLLHFEDVKHAIHRDEAVKRLKQYLTGYDKGQGGHFARTKDFLATAIDRADKLAQANNAHDGKASYTDVGKLVKFLTTLKPN